jgi:hypothetical protein
MVGGENGFRIMDMDGGRLVMLQVAEEQAGGWELRVPRFRLVLRRR